MNTQVRVIAGIVMMVMIIAAGSTTIAFDGTTVIAVQDNIDRIFLAINKLENKVDRMESNVLQQVDLMRSEQTQEFRQINTALNEVRGEIQTLQSDNLAIRQDIEGLKEDNRKLNNALLKITDVLESLQSQVEQTKLAVLQIKVEQQREFAQIAVNLIQIKSVLNEISNEVVRIDATVKEIKSDQSKGFNEVKLTLQQISRVVADLGSEVRTIEGRIQMLQSDVNMAKGDLNVLKLAISDIKKSLVKIEDLISSMDKKVIIVDKFPPIPFKKSLIYP